MVKWYDPKVVAMNTHRCRYALWDIPAHTPMRIVHDCGTGAVHVQADVDGIPRLAFVLLSELEPISATTAS